MEVLIVDLVRESILDIDRGIYHRSVPKIEILLPGFETIDQARAKSTSEQKGCVQEK